MSGQTPRNAAGPDDTVIRPPLPPIDPPPEPVQRRRKPVIVAVLGALLALVVALYIAGFLIAGDRLPKDAQVSGVAVGGLDRAQAIEKLSADLGARAAQPIEVTAPGKTARLTPADAGLTVDYGGRRADRSAEFPHHDAGRAADRRH